MSAAVTTDRGSRTSWSCAELADHRQRRAYSSNLRWSDNVAIRPQHAQVDEIVCAVSALQGHRRRTLGRLLERGERSGLEADADEVLYENHSG